MTGSGTTATLLVVLAALTWWAYPEVVGDVVDALLR
jgi:hypothetical protein